VQRDAKTALHHGLHPHPELIHEDSPMNEVRRVLLIGHSVLLEGFFIRLRAETDIRLARVALDDPHLLSRLEEFSPQIIIYLCEEANAFELLSRAPLGPDVRMLGLSVDRSQVLVIDRRLQQEMSMHDLRSLVLDGMPDEPRAAASARPL
jgi:hypothetical protein